MTMQYGDLISCGWGQIVCHSWFWSQPFYLRTFILLLKDWGKEQISCPILHREIYATKLIAMHSLWHYTQKANYYFGKWLFWEKYILENNFSGQLFCTGKPIWWCYCHTVTLWFWWEAISLLLIKQCFAKKTLAYTLIWQVMLNGNLYKNKFLLLIVTFSEQKRMVVSFDHDNLKNKGNIPVYTCIKGCVTICH